MFVCLFFYRSSPFCKLPRPLNYLVCSTDQYSCFGFLSKKKILETHPRIQPSPSTRIQKRLQILRDLFCILGRLFGYRKIPKISPGAYIFQRLFLRGLYSDIRRGLSTEGNVRFKIDWAIPIVGSTFTVLALFYFGFEGNFPSTSPRATSSPGRSPGGLYLEGPFQPRPQGLLAFQYGGGRREDPGTQQKSRD